MDALPDKNSIGKTFDRSSDDLGRENAEDPDVVAYREAKSSDDGTRVSIAELRADLESDRDATEVQ